MHCSEIERVGLYQKKYNFTHDWYDDLDRRVLSVSSDTGVQVSNFDIAEKVLIRQTRLYRRRIMLRLRLRNVMSLGVKYEKLCMIISLERDSGEWT